MSDPFEHFFDNTSFTANVIFVGNRCGQDNLLRSYTTGAIHFVRAGVADVLLPNAPPVRIQEPSLVFFPQASAHWLQGVDETGFELVCAITSFSKRFNIAIAQVLPAMTVLPLRELPFIAQTLDAFFAEAVSSEPGSHQLSNRLCEVVLGYLFRHIIGQGQLKSGAMAAAADPRIALVLKAIHSEFNQALELDTLAARAGMSRTRFIERFKALVGCPPHQYVTEYRMGIAQQLLAAGEPVKTVADRVGYASASAFVRKFHAAIGCSPGEWARTAARDEMATKAHEKATQVPNRLA